MHLLALFFVIDGSHAKKRLLAFNKNVKKVSIVSYFRKENIEYDNHYNLGKSPQGKYFLRFIKIIFDIPRLLKILNKNKDVNIVYAWNFDIALLYVLSSLFTSKKFTFIYEVADIKPILLSNSIVGKSLRIIEQFLLNKTNILCITSKEFLNNYFNKHYTLNCKIQLLENKVFPPIANIRINSSPIDSDKWRIGLVGLFRCRKSFELLHQLATELPNKIEIVLAGRMEKLVKDEFGLLIKQENITYLGEYIYPQDLQGIYSRIDIIWSADFSDSSKNSKWLLPNRTYEAGVFSVPQLSFIDNEATSKFIKSLKIGWVLKEVNLKTIIDFIKNLTEKEFKQIKVNYLKLPKHQFSGDDQIISLLQKISPA